MFYRKNGCLQIIDTQNTGYPGLPDSLGRIAGLSDPDLIVTEPAAPAVPPAAIGPEPEHGYCYYFQKTALAQQNQDPEHAYEYAIEALRSDMQPVYAPDLAPVVLAMIEANDLQSAGTMMESVQIGVPDLKYLCQYRQNRQPTETASSDLTDFYKSHGCL